MALSIPPISEELMKEVERVFAQIEIIPNITSNDEIWHNAGERKVVAFLQSKRRHTVVTGA